MGTGLALPWGPVPDIPLLSDWGKQLLGSAPVAEPQWPPLVEGVNTFDFLKTENVY